jgi:hypothetical protein
VADLQLQALQKHLDTRFDNAGKSVTAQLVFVTAAFQTLAVGILLWVNRRKYAAVDGYVAVLAFVMHVTDSTVLW